MANAHGSGRATPKQQVIEDNKRKIQAKRLARKQHPAAADDQKSIQIRLDA